MVAWAKLSKLEPRFAWFLDNLRRVYANVPLLEALKKPLGYVQFLKEFLSEKGEPEGVSVVSIGEAYSSILHRQSPSKL